MRIQIGMIAALFISATAIEIHGQASWKAPDAPVYIVAPNQFSEAGGAGAESAAKFGDLLMIEIFPERPPADESHRDDERRLYEKGRRIALYVDGQRQGDVQIESTRDFSCNSVAALVSPLSRGVSKMVSGLATNLEGIRSRSGRRRPANDNERTLAARLAETEFVNHGLMPSALTNMKVDSLQAIAIDRSGQKTIVGSFSVAAADRLFGENHHWVFLVARMKAGVLVPEMVQYDNYSSVGEITHPPIALFDHLDLDHDGTDELVLVVKGYESLSFQIFARRNEKWQHLSSGGESGC